MQDWLVQDEAAWRLGSFVFLLGIFALWEALNPRKVRVLMRQNRWFTNISMSVLNSLALRLFFPLLAVETATHASVNGWGLLNWTTLPFVWEFLIALILLDLAIYGQHVLTHYWPPLWRLHQVHHADRDVDVTTAIRFHPIEIAVSMLLKMAIVVALGPAAVAVIVFEILLNGTSMFNHANIRIPTMMDRMLRTVLVTPDMHRVHHSIIRGETNSNFGFNLSIWDRIFGTYRPQPEGGHDAMTIGLAEYRDAKPAGLLWSLALPFQAAKLDGNHGDHRPADRSPPVKGDQRETS